MTGERSPPTLPLTCPGCPGSSRRSRERDFFPCRQTVQRELLAPQQHHREQTGRGGRSCGQGAPAPLSPQRPAPVPPRTYLGGTRGWIAAVGAGSAGCCGSPSAAVAAEPRVASGRSPPASRLQGMRGRGTAAAPGLERAPQPPWPCRTLTLSRGGCEQL